MFIRFSKSNSTNYIADIFAIFLGDTEKKLTGKMKFTSYLTFNYIYLFNCQDYLC
jgi:hypothetical protein